MLWNAMLSNAMLWNAMLWNAMLWNAMLFSGNDTQIKTARFWFWRENYIV